MKVLVTGGAGFIGSNLVSALLREGHDVRVLDNFSTGHGGNLAGLDVELVEGDLRSYERVATATRGSSSCSIRPRCPRFPGRYRTRSRPTRSTSRGRSTCCSPRATKGSGGWSLPPPAPCTGTRPACRARSPSARSRSRRTRSPKLAAEHYCMAAHGVYGLETVALRYFNVFGEQQDPLSGYAAVISKFIRKLLAGETITIFGDGSASRDFTHVENVVQANLLAATADRTAGKVVNVAIGASQTVNALVAALGELLDLPVEPEYAPPRAGDVPESMADITLARELLGYEPGVDFATGLKRTVEWIADRFSREAQPAR